MPIERFCISLSLLLPACSNHPTNAQKFLVLSAVRCHLQQARAYELRDLRSDIVRRRYTKHGPSGNGFQRNSLPRGVFNAIVQDYGICAVEKLTCGGLEVCSSRVEHGQIQIWPQKFQHTVGLDDQVRGVSNFRA